MNGGREKRSAWVLITAGLLLLASCDRRPPAAEPVAGPATGVYSCNLRMVISFGGRSASLEAGCAVDPERGARLELRDPLGSARFLVLLNHREGVIFDPVRGLRTEWSEAEEALPWSPRDLWILLTGSREPGAPAWKPRPEGLLRATWRNGLGRLKVSGSPGEVGFLSEAEVRGPRRARLELRWLRVRHASLPDSFLLHPAIDTVPVPAEELLREVLR